VYVTYTQNIPFLVSTMLSSKMACERYQASWQLRLHACYSVIMSSSRHQQPQFNREGPATRACLSV
jgi:hypothetical protein